MLLFLAVFTDYLLEVLRLLAPGVAGGGKEPDAPIFRQFDGRVHSILDAASISDFSQIELAIFFDNRKPND